MVNIFCFSGTGNSLKTAQLISRKLGGELVPIIGANENRRRPEGITGFVFPVQHFDVPPVVVNTLNNMDFSKINYLFAAITSGGDPGNALYSLGKLCNSKGKGLDYGQDIKLGDNSLAMVTKPEVAVERLNQLEKQTEKIVEAVNNREISTHKFHFQLKSRLYSYITKLTLNQYYRIHNKAVFEERCNHCGLCAKICPVRNIQITNNKVEWHDQCADCFACINWCLQKAIRFGKLDVTKKPQYRSTGITANDIIQFYRK